MSIRQPQKAKLALDRICRVYAPTEAQQKQRAKTNEEDVIEAELDLIYAHMADMEPEDQIRARRTLKAIQTGQRRFGDSSQAASA